MYGKVLICDPVDSVLREKLSDKFEIDYNPEISAQDLLNVIGNYDVVVVRSRTKITRDVISRAKKLKIIARAGIGVDNIDTDYAEEKHIKVVYAPGSSTESVVEITLAMMVIGARSLFKGIENTKKNNFTKLKGIELEGKTLGILGFGRIGKATVRRAGGRSAARSAPGSRPPAADAAGRPALPPRAPGSPRAGCPRRGRWIRSIPRRSVAPSR